MGSLQHPAHDHALNLRLISEDFTRLISEDFSLQLKNRCEVCHKEIQGSTYCCEECKFFLHKSCAELPSDVQHPFHQQHPLKMFVDHQKYPDSSDDSASKYCNACGEGSRVYFHCSDCGNSFCSACTVDNMPHEDSHTRPADDLTALHFTHQHPLKSFHVGAGRLITCQLCEYCIEKGEAYGCFDCFHFLHKNCAGFSQEVRHPFHPKHPLTLLLFDPPEGSECNACRRDCKCSVYSCRQCQFNLHLDCAISTLEYEISEDRGLFIDHFSHQHRLKSFIVKMESKIPCKACRENISGETYGCVDCMFFIHKSCARLSPKVKHALHEEHSLALVPKSAYGPASLQCSSCDNSISSYAFAFSCQEGCEFVLDVKCALETLTCLDQGGLVKIECRWHDHPLQLCRKEIHTPISGPVSCEVCFKPVRGLAYKCSLKECKFLLHRSCADFPLEMHHPYHPQHTLIFNSQRRVYRCSACFTQEYPIAGFFCAECDFKLDLRCASRSPNLTFKHPLHEHSLSYFVAIEVPSRASLPLVSQTSLPSASQTSLPSAQEIEMCLQRAYHPSHAWASPCKACGRSCNVDFYRCVQCNFNIHADCSLPQLPHKIDGRHFHELTLADHFVDDDWGEYICDFCGKDRNPELGVYFCEECPKESTVTVHIECVIDKIPETLKTDGSSTVARLHEEIKSLQTRVDAADKGLDALRKHREALYKKLDEIKRERKRLL